MVGPSLSYCEPLARSVLTDTAPIKVNLRRMPYFVLGGALIVFTAFCLLFSGLVLWYDPKFGTAFWLTVTGLVFFGLPGLWFLGVAIKRPVALRMDKNGISGFYADPATWDEIDQINVVRSHKGHLMLGFALTDPIGFRDKQTPWGRYRYWANGRSFGHQVILPHLTLKNGQAEQLVVAARALKAAAAN